MWLMASPLQELGKILDLKGFVWDFLSFFEK